MSRPRKPRRAPRRPLLGSRAGEAALVACCGAAVIVALSTLGLWARIVLLVGLVPAAVWLHRLEHRRRHQRRLLSPLVLFTLAFVLALAPRAILLATGAPGRFFALDPASGRTVSAFLVPPQDRRAGTFNGVRNPSLEATARDWGPPVSNAKRGFGGTVVRVAGDGYDGVAAAGVRVRSGTGGTFIAVPAGDAFEAKAELRPGRIVSGSLAVKSLQRLPRGQLELNVIYYDADQEYIKDELLSGPGARAAVADPRPRRWYMLYGTSRVPRRAAFGNLVFVVHGAQDRRVYRFRLDAGLLLPKVGSREAFYAFTPTTGGDGGKPSPSAIQGRAPGSRAWADAADAAAGVAIVMLLAVFAGYVLPLGRALGRRAPPIDLPGLDDTRTRRLVIVFVCVGVLAYAWEMSTYGGYGGYLAAFTENPGGADGKFYIRMFATLPAGAAVLLLARRLTVGRREPWRALELVVIPLGFAIALSYWLKAVVAIPLLTVLLFWHFRRRHAAVWLGVFAACFAVLTPFVYQVRGAGGVDPSAMLRASYWQEFLINLQSRFFHFESLMVAIPFPNSEPPWQPLRDFFANAVPRVLWQDKPMALSPRFTERYLQDGLHARTDVGIVSLPGELWLVGGWVGIILVGLVFGVLLRAIETVFADSRHHAGTLLVAATLLTTLIFANDGWGLASTVVSVLLLAVGWLAPLQLARMTIARPKLPRKRYRRHPGLPPKPYPRHPSAVRRFAEP